MTGTVTPREQWARRTTCKRVGALGRARRSRKKNQRDRSDADQTNDKNVVAVRDKTKPAKGVADIGFAAMRATHGELARTPHARALPTKQGIWQLEH